MPYKTYPKYKASGVQWLGDIPEGWEVRKLKTLNVKVESGKREQGNEDFALSIGGEHIQNGKFYLKNPRYVSREFYKTSKNGKVKVGDTLLVKDGATIGKAMYVEKLPKDEIIVNEHVYKLVGSKHFFYLISTEETQFQFWLNNQSSAQEGINLNTLKNILFTIPSKYEQEKIAEFLDYKVGLIDEYVAKKRKMIELLGERKQTVINEAVCHGLDPSAPTKASGINWLGNIPQHWEVRKLKFTIRLNPHTKFDNEKNINVKIALENIESKTAKILELSSHSFAGIGTIFKKQDVLFGKLRPYLAKVACPDFEGNCVSDILVLSPNKKTWCFEYLKNRVLASDFIDIVDNSTYGAKMPRASWDFIGNLKIAIPPLTEQRQIVAHIEAESGKIDLLISRIEKQIALMEEYKTALISEAVTGKIDVRDYEL